MQRIRRKKFSGPAVWNSASPLSLQTLSTSEAIKSAPRAVSLRTILHNREYSSTHSSIHHPFRFLSCCSLLADSYVYCLLVLDCQFICSQSCAAHWAGVHSAKCVFQISLLLLLLSYKGLIVRWSRDSLQPSLLSAHRQVAPVSQTTQWRPTLATVV